MVALLAALGAGFDCASEGEIDLVLSFGVPADKIIYAHPCKPPAQVRYLNPKTSSCTIAQSDVHVQLCVHQGHYCIDT
jgi:diaminopimelate decarboxylase